MDRTIGDNHCSINKLNYYSQNGQQILYILGAIKGVQYTAKTFRVEDENGDTIPFYFISLSDVHSRIQRYLLYKNNEVRFVLRVCTEKALNALNFQYYDNIQKKYISFLKIDDQQLAELQKNSKVCEIEELKGYIYNDEKTLVIKGWMHREKDTTQTVQILINGQPLEYKECDYRSDNPFASIICDGKEDNFGFMYLVQLPEIDTCNIEIQTYTNNEWGTATEISCEQVKEAFEADLLVDFNEERILDLSIQLRFWALCTDGLKPEIKLSNSRSNNIKCSLRQIKRPDVSDYIWHDRQHEDCGYMILFPCPEEGMCTLTVTHPVTRKKVIREFNVKQSWKKVKENQDIYKSPIMCLKTYSIKKLKEDCKILYEDGWGEYKKRMEIRHIKDEFRYEQLFRQTQPTEKQLEIQKNKKFIQEPKISILVPAYRTPEQYLVELLDCLEEQTYSNWELCIADASMEDDSVEHIIKKYSECDKRFVYRKLDTNDGISENTNYALEMATGEYTALLDHDDLLTRDCLYEVIQAINENDNPDALYTDEDKINMEGTRHFDPNFKPDFNQDLLNQCNYITHLFVVKTEIAREVGGFRPEYNGSQDFDFIFRCTEKADQIIHIPKILYHWRCHMESTAMNPESKLYAFVAGAKAIQSHYDRIGISTEVSRTDNFGLYKTAFRQGMEHKITIIYINKHTGSANTYISKLEQVEIVEVDATSIKEVNEIVSNVSGEYILFMTHDVENLTDVKVRELMGQLQEEGIGIVSPLILNSDKIVQQAGVILGWKDFIGHPFQGENINDIGHQLRFLVQQNYYAIDGEVFLTKKKVFQQVDGFSQDVAEELRIVDYCLKVNQIGKRVLWTPHVQIIQDMENCKNKQLEKLDIQLFKDKWKIYFEKEDPHYNPNYSLQNKLYSLKSFMEVR